MKAVVLAGGIGARLKPYTTVFPKPLMPIGGHPVLEIVIQQLRYHGFKEVTLAVGHLAELIMTFFGDGSKYGLELKYSREEELLGTAGPLSLLKEELTDTFLVMNGDVLSSLDYAALMEYHKRNRCTATIALAKRDVRIDFGVIEVDEENSVLKYIEKPTMDYLVSTGIYVFEPEVLSYVKPKEKFDLPDLIKGLIKDGRKTMGFVNDAYWLDIGRPEDYEKANEDFETLKEKFLPGALG
jgi:NDP-sugar pyrophosphorylase family protein